MFAKCPEIRNTPAERLTSNYGHRYTVCHNNPTFKEISQRVDRTAVTVNEFKRGKVVYVGTLLTGETLEAFLRWLRRLAGVESVLDVPPGVRAFERRSHDTRFLFLLNPTDSPQPVTLGDEWRDAFTGERASAIDISPVDVRIVTLGL